MALSGLNAFPYADTKAEVEKQAANMIFYNRDHVDAILSALPRHEKSLETDMKTITDPKSKASWVRRDLRSFRNFPLGGKPLEMLIAFVKDESRPIDQRVIAAEALGWYRIYYNKASIVAALKDYKPQDASLANELEKTLVRLQGKNR